MVRWLSTLILWNISLLMGVVSSRMTMPPPQGRKAHKTLTNTNWVNIFWKSGVRSCKVPKTSRVDSISRCFCGSWWFIHFISICTVYHWNLTFYLLLHNNLLLSSRKGLSYDYNISKKNQSCRDLQTLEISVFLL